MRRGLGSDAQVLSESKRDLLPPFSHVSFPRETAYPRRSRLNLVVNIASNRLKLSACMSPCEKSLTHQVKTEPFCWCRRVHVSTEGCTYMKPQ